MGTISRRIGQAIDVARTINKAGLGEVYRSIKILGDHPPAIAQSSNGLGIFVGYERDALFNAVREDRWHEPHFKAISELLIKDDWNILDLGANIGTHTVMCSKLASRGKVFSFEPQSLTYSILQRNIILNGCDNVVTYRFAVSDASDEIISMSSFSFSGDLINNGVVGVSEAKSLGDRALTIKLDDLDLPIINFAKIDVQGSEIRALRGAIDLITKYKPFIFLEIEEQHLKRLNSSSEEVINFMLDLDYALYRVETDYPCDHVCVPKTSTVAFEANILPKLGFATSKIEGRKAILKFLNDYDQNYSSVEIVH